MRVNQTPALLCFIFLLLCISACSNRSQPAPVLSLSTTVATPENLTEITGDIYKVQRGDTLFAIALYSGNDYRDLARLNGLTEPYIISLGQSLKLTAGEAPTSSREVKSTNRTVQNSNKIEIDQKQEQAYGEERSKNHREKQGNKTSVSNKPDKKLYWIWPAEGNRKFATVGSDGTKRGVDIKGRFGSKIIAAADGKVVYAGNAIKGYGNLVIIKHNDNYLSAYAHNKSILVSEQTYVRQGQQIASMGNSGASDVMLHFEIRKKGKSVDPFVYLPAR
jgi:lipoprotein NlpD